MMPFFRFRMFSLEAALVGFLFSVPALTSAAVPRTVSGPDGTGPSSNGTSMTTDGSSSLTPSNCCFVVQDTITEYWWQNYTTSTIYGIVNATSITTLVTPYIDTTVTNVVTHVNTINATQLTSSPTGYNTATLMLNAAPQPSQVTGSPDGLNSTQIITAGVTIQSPAAFWVYSTVKVITVPAVTDMNGHVTCATASIATAFFPLDRFSTLTYVDTVSGVNSNAEAYFGGYDLPRIRTTAVLVGSTSWHLSLSSFTESFGYPTETPYTTDVRTIYAYTGPIYNFSTVTVADAGSITNSPIPTGITITFPTPFIYLPSPRRSAEGIPRDTCAHSGPNENYGYVPQTVLEYMTAMPIISSQYPGLASCLPGGPSILRVFAACSAAAPVEQNLASDLTESTTITVSGGGLYSSTAPVLPTVSTSPSPSQAPPAMSLAATPPASNLSPSSQSSVIQFQPTIPSSTTIISGTPVVIIPSPSTIPLSSLVDLSTPLAGFTTISSGTPVVVITAPTTIVLAPTPAPATPALPGTTTTISDTPVVIISGPTTIPLSRLSALSTLLSGVTTTISGTPVMIITGPTTIALPPTATPLLPGSTIVISGAPFIILSTPATIPVISGVSISGSTTVLGGSTIVFTTGTVSGKTSVIGKTTAVVVSGTQTVTLSPSSTTASKPVQVSSGMSNFAPKSSWGLLSSIGILCAIIL